jgi:hypothetical protein
MLIESVRRGICPALLARVLKVRGRDVQNGESAQRRIPHAIRAVTALVAIAVAATWACVSSRRWLLAATLATCALLAVLSLGKPKPIQIFQQPEAPETTFDDVTNLGVQTNGSWFHRWMADAANSRETTVRGLTLDAPPADDSEPPESTRLTRRLDAVRSRQSKGAVLTGKIDTGKTDAGSPVARQSSNAPLRPPIRVAPPQTADSSSDVLHSTPESVFR